jgi:AraC-like DNA-binding protein
MSQLTIPQDTSFIQKRIWLGDKASDEVIGCGFMEKPAGVDHHNYSTKCWSLSYVIRGEGELFINGETIPVKAGDIFERRPLEVHSSSVKSTNPEWMEAFLDLGPKMYQALLAMGVCRPGPHVQHLGMSQATVQAFHSLHQSYLKDGEAHWTTLASKTFDLALQILSRINSPKEQSDRIMIQEAERSLSNRLAERFDLQRWCKEQGWDYHRFRRIFKEATGWSPSQYRIKKRIDHACLLMELEPSQKLKYFAHQLGYPSVYEFSNQFRTIKNVSPGQYKKSLYR